MFIRKRDLYRRLADAYEAGYLDGDAGEPFSNGYWVTSELVPLLPGEEPESGSDYSGFMDSSSEDDGRIGALGYEL